MRLKPFKMLLIRSIRKLLYLDGYTISGARNRLHKPNSKKNQIDVIEKYIHLNSTVIKDVARLGGDISDYVPKCVENALFEKYNN